MGFEYDFTNGNCRVVYTVGSGSAINQAMLRRVQEAGESFFLLPVYIENTFGGTALCYDISNVTNLLAWKDEASPSEAAMIDRRIEEAVRDLEMNMIPREELVMDPRFIYVDDRSGEVRLMALPISMAGSFESEPASSAGGFSGAAFSEPTTGRPDAWGGAGMETDKSGGWGGPGMETDRSGGWERAETDTDKSRWDTAEPATERFDDWGRTDPEPAAAPAAAPAASGASPWSVPGGFEAPGSFGSTPAAAPASDTGWASGFDDDGWSRAEATVRPQPVPETPAPEFDADDGWSRAEATIGSGFPSARESFKTPETPSAPESFEMPETPSAPESFEMPETPSAPESFEMPETPSAPESFEMPDTPSVPEIDKYEVTDCPKPPELPSAVPAPDSYEVPEVPEEPVMPEMSFAPTAPDGFDFPEAPKAPAAPGRPEVFDTLDRSESTYSWNNSPRARDAYSSYHRSALDGWETPAPRRRTVLDSPGGYDEDDERTVMLGMGDDDEATVMLGGYSRSTARLTRQRTGEVFRLERNENKIGKRERSVDICVRNNPALSREHCVIRLLSGSYYLEDLNSSNGTSVNGELIAPGKMVRLKNGNKIRMADEDFIFEEA